MPKKLSEFTEFEAEKYLEYLMRNEAEALLKSGAFKIPQEKTVNRVIHDQWSCYAYGDTVKFVYIKCSSNPEYRAKKGLRNSVISKTTASETERFSQSVSRSKARIFELASCNEFRWFCTFTQDEKMRDRFDLGEFRKDFAQLVRNLNRKRSENDKIKYLLIPEKHKDGAWHMHGLLKGLSEADLTEFKLSDRIPLRIKNTLKSGKKVYNWSNYARKFGYFTCTEVENSEACSKYITKYITKEFQAPVREMGMHLFFASQGLKGRECIVKNSEEACPISEWDFENDYVKIAYLKMTPEN